MTLERRAVFLEEMGIGPLWQRRDVPEIADVPTVVVEPVDVVDAFDAADPVAVFDAPPPVADAPPANAVASMDWIQLKESVAGCVKCGLCKGRTKTVFGVGDEKAKWLFIGEGPGRNEDQTGEPFVGPAGKLLDNMLK
ncbi:uracil-DNA glycosylase, partial [Noviherbaspirillum denitrificans]|uniref:uracil-DNA glycosylase n=1 Tax=Noviherbaspirillum denitrificans TaxID=1968433 RepID=UPI002351F700